MTLTQADRNPVGPVRVQLRRTKGWRMPLNTVSVARPGKWGNPHKVGVSLAPNGDGTYRFMTAADAVARYRDEYLPYWTNAEARCAGALALDLAELRGKNLACWCPLDQPCHADVLLKLANAENNHGE